MTDLLLENYNYDVPPELIAQKPAPNRESSRLFILNRQNASFNHKYFSDIVDFLGQNCALVINNAKVVPARLWGKKETGGKVEVLFLSPHIENNNIYSVLMKPFLPQGKRVFFEDNYECEIVSKKEDGGVLVQFNKGGILDFLEKRGIMPLPPYIKRKEGLGSELRDFDKERYQTTYAKELGAIAAPTAGLHFTPQILEKIEKKGVEIIQLTLYVGWGTFKPITKSAISEHRMPSETLSIDSPNAAKLNKCLKEGRKIIAAGTTSARALESLAQRSEGNQIESFSGETDIFIYPGYSFKIVGGLLTNFHLPKSTPLMMASAFASRNLLLKAYQEAVNRKYRFFSYGDAMLIL